ncbi:hypothetical protein NE237_016719 [Protea cynaroides]|uniref:Uncharacterized protein n=1 Tax=Protea cynaroides TaxID=273540 RepID=A0A9Q0HHP6_9MAGN|nr:hypothetical protein NE237_016719 [Protea cynaroides]
MFKYLKSLYTPRNRWTYSSLLLQNNGNPLINSLTTFDKDEDLKTINIAFGSHSIAPMLIEQPKEKWREKLRRSSKEIFHLFSIPFRNFLISGQILSIFISKFSYHCNKAALVVHSTTRPTGNLGSQEAIRPQEVAVNQPTVPFIYRHNEHDDDSNGNGSRNRGASKSDPLIADQVRVIGTDHFETTHNFNDVTVVDRGFSHGDIVTAALNPTGQVGIVVDVNLSVDLLAADGSIIKDVSSRDLKRVREFSVGDYVVLGPWLGRVYSVLDNVTVLFDDGAMCKVMNAHPLWLKPVSKHIIEGGHFPFYPGQRVRACSSSVFMNSRWFSGLWRANRLEGTVTKVTIGSVFISWIESADSGSGFGSSTTPDEEQNPEDLKLLACFAHAKWRRGHWCLFPLYSQSSSIQEDKGSIGVKHEDLTIDELVSADLESGYSSEEGIEEILGGDCPSFQNTEAVDLDLVPELDENSGNVGNKVSSECSSCDYVVEKASDDSDDIDVAGRVGVVKSVNAKEKTAIVRWSKTVDRPEDPGRYITGFKDGDIEVTWADGMVSTVGPQSIYAFGFNGNEESIGAGSEVIDDAASGETVNEEEINVLEHAEEDAELQSAIDNNPEAEDIITVHSEENNSRRNGPLSISRGRKQTDPLCLEFGDKNAISEFYVCL